MYQYQRRRGIVEAIQWTGNNWEQVRTFAGENVEWFGPRNEWCTIQTGDPDRPPTTPVPTGHWIVRNTDTGVYSIWDQQEFVDTYEELYDIDPGHPQPAQPLDHWSSLRNRLAAGPTEHDTVYTFSDGDLKGQVAMWTLKDARADYLQKLLDERDGIEATLHRFVHVTQQLVTAAGDPTMLPPKLATELETARSMLDNTAIPVNHPD